MFLKHISVNNKLYLHLIFSVEIFPLCTWYWILIGYSRLHWNFLNLFSGSFSCNLSIFLCHAIYTIYTYTVYCCSFCCGSLSVYPCGFLSIFYSIYFICLCAIHINAPCQCTLLTVSLCMCVGVVCMYLNANIKFMSNVCLTRNI